MKVFIENEAGSNQKNIFNEDTLEYRKTYTVSANYPFPYGFIPNTKSGDGDCLDCFVLTDKPLKSGQIIDAEPIGMYEQVENGETDHKILAVPIGDTWKTDATLEQNFRTFGATVFSHRPNNNVEIGRFLGLDDALTLLRQAEGK